jgi:hypothetical protein
MISLYKTTVKNAYVPDFHADDKNISIIFISEYPFWCLMPFTEGGNRI